MLHHLVHREAYLSGLPCRASGPAGLPTNQLVRMSHVLGMSGVDGLGNRVGDQDATRHPYRRRLEDDPRSSPPDLAAAVP